MRVLVVILATLLVSTGVGIFLRNHPGVFILNYGDTTFQASFAFFIAAVFFLVVSLFVIFVIVSGLVNMPKNYQRWTRLRRYRQSEKYLTRGLLCSFEGDWQRAEEAFMKGAGYSRAPMLNYLGAARSAQQQGDISKRDHYLHLAHECSSNPALAVGLTQAELQLGQNQTEQAYATLRHLEGKGAGRDQAKLMLLKTCSDLKEWHGVLEILEKQGGKKLLRPEEIKAWQLQAYAGLLKKAGESNDRSRLDDTWNDIPKKLQKELHLLEVYVQERLRFAETEDCEVLLRNVLKHQWDHEIVRLYGLVNGEDSTRQQVFAEGLLKSHARDPVLLLTIGRLCMRNSLWGKAKSSFEECLEIQQGPEVYQELATLLEQQGDHATAAEYYQKGLSLATGLNHVASGNKVKSLKFKG